MPKFRSEGLSLTVEDVERPVAFYVGKLGLELAVDRIRATGRAGPPVDRLAIGLIRWASAASAPDSMHYPE